MDYRSLALDMIDDFGCDAKKMLEACLCYMSQGDVEDMLRVNEYMTLVEEVEE